MATTTAGTKPAKVLDDAVADAAAAVESARGVLAEWEAKEATATAELASLQERAGTEVLDNPDAEDSITTSMNVLRGRIDIAQRAIVAQRPRLLLAERRYLSAEADRLEAPIAAPEAELGRHEERTESLLRQLEEHEGTYVPEAQLMSLRHSLRDQVLFEGPTSWTVPKSTRLRRQITAKRRSVVVLRKLADGEDPAALVTSWGVSRSEAYPACVHGPEALVPAPAYLRSVEQARITVAELEDLLERLPDEIRDWEQRQRSEAPHVTLLGLERRRQRLVDLPRQLEQAREALAEVSGG